MSQVEALAFLARYGYSRWYILKKCIDLHALSRYIVLFHGHPEPPDLP
jgi:hypothetical protein